jgi:hypothetical protein
MFTEEYDKLGDMDKDVFSKLVNLLLLQNYIIRDSFNAREGTAGLSQEYRFIERNYSLFESYLKYGKWILHKDDTYGVIYCRNTAGHNKFTLNKVTTIMLYLLRFLYEEGREKVTLQRNIIVTISEIVERLVYLGVTNKKLPDNDLIDSLSTLRKFKIIDKIGGKYTDPETKIIIYPSILFVITNDRINGLTEFTNNGENDTAVEIDEDIGEEE